jgi:hypothetical protein
MNFLSLRMGFVVILFGGLIVVKEFMTYAFLEKCNC